MSDDTSAASPAPTRSIDLEIEIDASPGEVWSALTEPDKLASWFPLESRVRPGEGGSVFLSWGPEVQWETRIERWEPRRHLRWVDPMPSDAPPGSVPVAVDFSIETRGGKTVLRMVNSGFSGDPEWDGQYAAIHGGWTWFLFHLKSYLEVHGLDLTRQMSWVRRPFEEPALALWERLTGPDGLDIGHGPSELAVGDPVRFQLDAGEVLNGVVETLNLPYQLGASLDGLEGALLFIEIESKSGPIGIWLSTFGLEDGPLQRARSAVERLARRVLARG